MTEITALVLLGIIIVPPILGIFMIIAIEMYSMYYQEYVEFFWKKIKENYIQMIVMSILIIIFVSTFK